MITFSPTAAHTNSNASIVFYHNAPSLKDTVLVSGTGGLPPTGVPGSQSNLPTVFKLHNSYPNPFNPSTTIQYDLPQESKVMIKVYSILGQQIATLVDGVVPAGYHQVIWRGSRDDGKTVAGGVYFYRIFAQPLGKGSGLVQTKKMVMLK